MATETQTDPRPFGTSEFNGFKGAPTIIVLKKDYRPYDGDITVDAGSTVTVPAEEAARAIEMGIAQTPEDAAKTPAEVDAVAMLTDLGYTVTAPKPLIPKATFPAPKVDKHA